MAVSSTVNIIGVSGGPSCYDIGRVQGMSGLGLLGAEKRVFHTMSGGIIEAVNGHKDGYDTCRADMKTYALFSAHSRLLTLEHPQYGSLTNRGIHSHALNLPYTSQILRLHSSVESRLHNLQPYILALQIELSHASQHSPVLIIDPRFRFSTRKASRR